MAVHLQARNVTRLCFALSLAFFFTVLALGTLRAITARAEAPLTQTGVANVVIVDFSFSPSTITVPVGTTVVWTNNGTFTHTTTSDAAVWDSGSLGPGQVFSETFNLIGDYSYHCNIHFHHARHGRRYGHRLVPADDCQVGEQGVREARQFSHRRSRPRVRHKIWQTFCPWKTARLCRMTHHPELHSGLPL